MLYRDKRWFPPSKFNIVWGGWGYILVGKGILKLGMPKKRECLNTFDAHCAYMLVLYGHRS